MREATRCKRFKLNSSFGKDFYVKFDISSVMQQVAVFERLRLSRIKFLNTAALYNIVNINFE